MKKAGETGDRHPIQDHPRHPIQDHRIAQPLSLAAISAPLATRRKECVRWSERPELATSMHLRGDPAQIAGQTAQAKSAVGEKWWDALKGGQAGLSVCGWGSSAGD